MTENKIGKLWLDFILHEVILSADRQGRAQRVKTIIFCFIFLGVPCAFARGKKKFSRKAAKNAKIKKNND